MANYDQVLWALDTQTQPFDFEGLCVDLLGREGYRHIVPLGGNKDHGRDAEIRCWQGASSSGSVVAFQFSLQGTWEKKLRTDAAKIGAYCPNISELVFVSSRAIPAAKQDQLRDEFKVKRGWKLTFYCRGWFSHRLTEYHQDLAMKYWGLDLPKTLGYAASMVDTSDLDEDVFKQATEGVSPEFARAAIVASIRKEPASIDNWHRLARFEFMARNYADALVAVNRALQLAPEDQLLVLNMTNFKGAILAELGMEKGSRILLIEARDIFSEAAKRMNRAVDHFNVANVLGALSEDDAAKEHYEKCVVLQPSYAEAWKNLGSLLLKIGVGDRDRAIECFDRALQLKPKLVEAHLSKATAQLLAFENASESVRCFELAYAACSEIDRRWKYIRYWFSRALLAVDRDDDALTQIEMELAMRPDDLFLLNQKAAVLSKLRKRSEAHREAAIGFFEFRARAIHDDFAGLLELSEIFTELGCPERTWKSIDASLVCEPYTVSAVAKEAQISIASFQDGLRYGRLYGKFRKRFTLEDHCATLHSYGLSPDPTILPALNYVLMAPFGVAAREIHEASRKNTDPEVAHLFTKTLNTVSSVFLSFGPHWLANRKPDTTDERLKLLAFGIEYLADIVVAEAARLIAFPGGIYGVSNNTLNQRGDALKGVHAEIGSRLLEPVLRHWNMLNGNRLGEPSQADG